METNAAVGRAVNGKAEGIKSDLGGTTNKKGKCSVEAALLTRRTGNRQHCYCHRNTVRRREDVCQQPSDIERNVFDARSLKSRKTEGTASCSCLFYFLLCSALSPYVPSRPPAPWNLRPCARLTPSLPLELHGRRRHQGEPGHNTRRHPAQIPRARSTVARRGRIRPPSPPPRTRGGSSTSGRAAPPRTHGAGTAEGTRTCLDPNEKRG